MKVYLDNNIFVYIENESLTVSELENIIGKSIDKIYYSASHIQETLERKGETEERRIERINERLYTIEEVTKGNYLYEDLNHVFYEQIVSPFEVIKTITEVDFAQSLMKKMSNLISEQQKEESRKLLKIKPSEINNYSPSEVVEQLNRKIEQANHEYTFLNIIETGISYHPDGKTFGRTNRIAGIFELLDMFGYWKDAYTEKSNYARLWDSSHASFAANCDYFISDDKRTRNKTKVVYDIYDIETKVISSKG